MNTFFIFQGIYEGPAHLRYIYTVNCVFDFIKKGYIINLTFTPSHTANKKDLAKKKKRSPTVFITIKMMFQWKISTAAIIKGEIDDVFHPITMQCAPQVRQQYSAHLKHTPNEQTIKNFAALKKLFRHESFDHITKKRTKFIACSMAMKGGVATKSQDLFITIFYRVRAWAGPKYDIGPESAMFYSKHFGSHKKLCKLYESCQYDEAIRVFTKKLPGQTKFIPKASLHTSITIFNYFVRNYSHLLPEFQVDILLWGANPFRSSY